MANINNTNNDNQVNINAQSNNNIVYSTKLEPSKWNVMVRVLHQKYVKKLHRDSAKKLFYLFLKQVKKLIK